jgi:gamma-glutamylcyclotransferase (GGCT)/AIG2-like uncharacterized protein YtfP
LSGLYNTKKFDLYNKGILDFKDLPEGLRLSPSQELQVKAELTGERVINQEGIKAFLDELYYPLYFIDFETFAPPIPPFDNLRPYQKIPFQYSLHYLEKEGGDLKHKEFLAEEGADPREVLARSITENIPEGACILAYNSSFEKNVIRELAEQFPQYSTQLLNIHNRLVDLMMPFQNKYLYTKEMRGSYSIKSVLPALVPELGYDRLEIPDGNAASKAYSALHMIADKEEVKKIRRNLLEYCNLDTLGMVKLLEQLKSLKQMYYFAYGSNMHHEEFATICPGKPFVSKGCISGYKFVYDGHSSGRRGPVANIVESNEGVVWGVLFEIDEKCLKALDKKEGHPKSYRRKSIKVTHEDGSSYLAEVYYREGQEIGEPPDDYRQIVVQGAKYRRLPKEYIEKYLC